MIRVTKRHRSGRDEYYLSYNYGVDGKSRHIRKFIGTTPPTQREVQGLMSRYWAWFEYEAIARRSKYSTEKYSTGVLNREDIERLERIKYSFLTVLSHLNPNEIERYNEDLELDYIHGTTAMEGNSLTLPQVHRLLKDGKVPDNKDKREIYEVENFRKVQKLRERYNGPVDLKFIRKLHSLILDNIDYENAGVFRRIDVSVGGEFRGSPPDLVEEELEELVVWYRDNSFSVKRWIERGRPLIEHPFVLAAVFHERFERIHPFIDGNGRVGREIFNYMLKRYELPRFLFMSADRDAYLDALTKGHGGDVSGMVRVFFGLYTSTIADIIVDNEKRAQIIEDKMRIQKKLEDFFRG